MFLHLSSVILFTGGCLPQCMLGYTPPSQADTPAGQTPHGMTPPGRHLQGRHPPGRHPPGADTPPADTPPGRHPLPSACWDTHPLAQCMLGCTPPPSVCWDRLLRTVRILLECILVQQTKTFAPYLFVA